MKKENRCAKLIERDASVPFAEVDTPNIPTLSGCQRRININSIKLHGLFKLHGQAIQRFFENLKIVLTLCISDNKMDLIKPPAKLILQENFFPAIGDFLWGIVENSATNSTECQAAMIVMSCCAQDGAHS